MFIDLDRFKVVNDTLGHLAGDALLQQVAARIGGCLRASDTVGRLGGDEFAVLVTDPEGEYDVSVVARRLVDILAQPVTLEGQELFVSASIGITLYPDDCDDLEKLIRNADTAMYRAKELGRNNFQFFTAAMNARVKEQLQLETDLRRAVQRQEFILHYQPKVSCSQGSITGFEALLRWQHPVRGLVSPMEFIPLLEETGLIVPVGTWVLQQACLQAARWHRAGHTNLSMAVNLSARQLQSADLVAEVQDALEASGLPAAALELELTESLLMSHVEDNIALLNRLKATGLRLSVDDFGTGYSSLAYLKRLPLDTVKVDRAFVQDITADPGDASITRAVITMAHNLRLKVVAEGVETEGQIALLVANHCDEMQGFYFSRPVPAAEAHLLLHKGRVLPGHLRSRPGQVPTVLLALTAPALRHTLGHALEAAQLRVLLAGGGEEGLAALAQQRVDAIVADAGLTDSAGRAFLERAGQMQPEAGFLLLTSPDLMSSAAADLPAHLAGHLMSRELGTDTLVAGVMEALRQRSLMQENQRLNQEIQSAGVELSRLGQELESLQESQNRRSQSPLVADISQEVLQELPVAVIGVDASGMVAYANAAAERLWPGCGLIGNEGADFLSPEIQDLLARGGGAIDVSLAALGFCRVLCRPFGAAAQARGLLLLLWPLQEITDKNSQ
ncbi:MAG TPA: EAL domain-containing protein, partial [Azospira sp.]|nr:EAL domain-containing protein [Azospira sp.]